MSQLAIKGHPTRSKEVIGILSMLGGTNRENCWGIFDTSLYLINALGDIEERSLSDDFNYQTYTLEEFFEKFPYKIGDKVTIEKYKQIFEILSVRWCTERNIIVYQTSNGWYCADKLQPYKEETMKVSEEFYNKYCIKCGSQRCTAEGEWLEECEYYKHYKEETMEELRIDFPEGYDYAGIENKQVIFTKIKPQYPKTYEECHELMVQWKEYDCNPNSELILCDAPIHDFCKLIVARNIYWKIAGEHMGLGKPWEPDLDNEDKRNYVITCQGNNIIKDVYFIKNTILAFPTEEMRDTFYENFKELIEQCKELL